LPTCEVHVRSEMLHDLHRDLRLRAAGGRTCGRISEGNPPSQWQNVECRGCQSPKLRFDRRAVHGRKAIEVTRSASRASAFGLFRAGVPVIDGSFVRLTEPFHPALKGWSSLEKGDGNAGFAHSLNKVRSAPRLRPALDPFLLQHHVNQTKANQIKDWADDGSSGFYQRQRNQA
jgi:hypothetical protein